MINDSALSTTRLLTAVAFAALFAHHAFGATYFVSKLGDDSDGSSWAKAFRTIQSALDAIPDDAGGHRIVIRPDTYMEANLNPSHRGAQGRYNVIESDYDGSLGSGSTGYAVIDSSDPNRGLQSVDWWSAFKANPEFSGIAWDRWHLKRIYATGGDAGLFWDFPPKIESFSVVVEDSVGIGRAFGGGAAHFLARPDEPVLFKRCTLWCLDWWGDAAGAYVRAENDAMPQQPDITFEDCTLVGPDNALQAGNPGFSTYSRVKLKGCRLVSLNFSQPRGTPGGGVIYATIDGKFLHVDLEDCTLMGYKIFGAGEGEVTYTTEGSVRAYVQFEQEVPKGMITLGAWPVETFQSLTPPMPEHRPVLRRDSFLMKGMCEVTPVVWNGRACLMEAVRPASGGSTEEFYLVLKDLDSGKQLARFAEGYGLACAIVHGDTFYAFASRYENSDWNDVTVFWSRDLTNWESRIVIEQENEHLFNSSVCAGPDGFVMAYESNDSKYPAFTTKFARSTDLLNWTKERDAIFGADRYTACPCIRYADGRYYMMYLEHKTPRWWFETYLARSADLRTWELSPRNPVLRPEGDGEGINASDVDLIEIGGTTYVYFCVADQRTWANVKRAAFDGPLSNFFRSYFD